MQARRKLLWIEGAGAKDYMGVVVKVWPHMSYKCALNELAGSHYTLQDKEIPACIIATVCIIYSNKILLYRFIHSLLKKEYSDFCFPADMAAAEDHVN